MTTTAWQFASELIMQSVAITYHFLFLGSSRTMDKVMVLAYITHGFVIQPYFLLVGDSVFRNHVISHGYMAALYKALKQ